MNSRYIGATLKKERNSKGLTQEKLARLANLSTGHIIRLENTKKTNPTLTTLKRIAKVLKIPVETFLIKPDARGGGEPS